MTKNEIEEFISTITTNIEQIKKNIEHELENLQNELDYLYDKINEKKKPIKKCILYGGEISAFQFTNENKNKILNELSGSVGVGFEDSKPIIKVTNIYGGTLVARLGDWIVEEPSLGHYRIISNDYFQKNFLQNKKGVI